MTTLNVTTADFPLTINLTAVKPPPTPPPSSTLAIKVSGNKFVDAAGNTLRLKAANCSGLEGYAIQNLPWMNQDPWAGRAPNLAAVKWWGFNAIRVPLNQASWLAQIVTDYPSGATRHADPWGNYKATVKAVVDGATALGMYVVLDLHLSSANAVVPPGTTKVPIGAVNQNAMADFDNSIAFWASLATAYKGYPNVVFDLFNEPYMDNFVGVVGVTNPESAVAWKILRDGGTNQQILAFSGANGATTLVRQNWQAAGMQALLNAVRATGATNVCLAAGLSYALNVAQWVQFAPVDPLKQLACSWHGYASSADNTKPAYATSLTTDLPAILAAGYPIFCGETGDFTAAGQATWLPVLLPVLDALGVSVAFWTWDAWGQSQFNLITDSAGAPTAGEGAVVKAWLPKA